MADVLEVCEKDNLKQAMIIDQNLYESDSEFEEDFALMTGVKKKDKLHKNENYSYNDEDIVTDENTEQNTDLENEDSVNSDEPDSVSDLELSDSDSESCTKTIEMRGVKRQTPVDDSKANKKRKTLKKNKNLLQEFVEESIEENKVKLKNEHGKTSNKNKNKKKHKENLIFDKFSDESEDECGSNNDFSIEEDENTNEDSVEEEQKQDGEYWEDIYGRTRDRQGNVVQVNAYS